jgi:hypothetical protein
VQGATTDNAVETSLVVAAQAGDTTSFEALVRRHIDRLYGAARLMLRDVDLAEDAVQHALVRAWRDLPSLRDPNRFEGWLQKLLVRACYDQARQRRRCSARSACWSRSANDSRERNRHSAIATRSAERCEPFRVPYGVTCDDFSVRVQLSGERRFTFLYDENGVLVERVRHITYRGRFRTR